MYIIVWGWCCKLAFLDENPNSICRYLEFSNFYNNALHLSIDLIV